MLLAPSTSGSAKPRYFATVPTQEILPIVNSRFESSVRGIYVIGDVTGVPLVKLAANQGVAVVAKMEAGGVFRRDNTDDRLDLVIIGAGPAGLSAAIEAAKRGLKYVVLERSKIVSTVRSFPPGKMVYCEPHSITDQSELDFDGDLEKDEFLSRITRLVADRQLKIKEDTEVSRVHKVGERHFNVETQSGHRFPARQVLVAVGRQGQPRLLDCPGSDMAHKVTYRFHTVEDYRDQDVLLVGGGNSAIEAALMLSGHNRVTLSYRGDDFYRAKEDNRRLLAQAEQDGRLTIIRGSNVRSVREHEVELDVGGKSVTIPNDQVIVQIGTLPPVDFLMDMGLELDGVWTKKRLLFSAVGLAAGVFIYFFSKYFVLHPAAADDGVIYVPGFRWLYYVVPTYFSNAYGMYYLLYFSAIGVFGFYWAIRSKHRLIWRRNLTIIVTQWTLWWGIPIFLAVFLGRNPWTPLIARSLNAWPLNIGAFKLDPAVGPGDPQWWQTVAVVGVVWAVVLTFIVIPIVTIRWGKIYCTYFCSCGALAETVGNSFRHRGPKGDWPRRLERLGFVFIPLAVIATVADLIGFKGPLGYYNVWVETFLAGAVAIGMYPFLGQRVWCRMWCPLAFWMNFWGRWSTFKIAAEKGKCIDCNVCNQYCQMGIDIKSRALAGKPVTLDSTPCVGCAECVVRCPMEILHLGDLPEKQLVPLKPASPSRSDRKADEPQRQTPAA